jgi:lipopolysaccharide heptosyltransferase II
MYKIINKKKRFLVSTADLIGRSIFSVIKRSEPGVPFPPKIKKILIIRLAYLGDVVMTLPVLKPLHEHFQEARISFLTNASAAELLKGNPYLDNVIPYDAFWFYPKSRVRALKEYLLMLKKIREERFDLVLDLRGDIRNIFLVAYLSKAPYRISYEIGGGGHFLSSVAPFYEVKHKIDFHLDIIRFLGADTQTWNWDFYLDPDEIQEMKTILQNAGIGPEDIVVGIHPGGRKPLKMWNPEKFAVLADRIIEEYSAKVIFFGDFKETGLIENVIRRMKHSTINLAGETTIRQLAAAIRCCRLFIGNDSASIHIAAAQKVPVVAIFGPSKSEETRPYGRGNVVAEIANMPCRSSCDEDQCLFEKRHECMKNISPEKVFDAVASCLSSTLADRKEN